MRTPKPKFAKGDIVYSKYLIPAYADKPFIGRDTALRVSHVTGKGTLRDPWHVVVTLDGHFWHLVPEDLTNSI